MKRGEVWTVAGGRDYAGKPRPAIVIQDDAFSATASITICGLTTTIIPAIHSRVTVGPSPFNGLSVPSQIMADKVTTVARAKLDRRIGRLSGSDMTRLNRALLTFLGLGQSTNST